MDDYDLFNISFDNSENIPSNDPNAIEIPDEIKSGFPYVLIW